MQNRQMYLRYRNVGAGGIIVAFFGFALGAAFAPAVLLGVLGVVMVPYGYIKAAQFKPSK